jgi:predicted CXXCH cytochrome family protein
MTRITPTALLALVLAPALAAQDPPHDGSNDINCLSCHVLHNAPGAHFTNVEGAINLCMSCHNPLGVAPVETHAPAGQDIACTECHNPHTQEQQAVHGSGFSMLVKTTISTPNSGDQLVKLMAPSGPNSFADGDAVYDGVCEVCHTQTNHHRNNPSGGHAHNNALDCRMCHPHTSGFQPTGGECTDCHAYSQPIGGDYRRQIVENNGDGNGDFVKPFHHVDDLSGQESVEAGDCGVCHDQSDHMQNPDPEVLLADPDGGASHRFTGQAGGLVSGFCVGCHDADGRNGDLTPFSSGRAPADIHHDWSSSAHATAAPGAECMECHTNGHGGDDPQFLGGVEEAVCFFCHGPGGGAADVWTDLQRSYRHPVEATTLVHELGEDPIGMPRHVECADCHDPHAANSALGGPPPATPGAMLSVSGVDAGGAAVAEAAFGYEVCFKCHSGAAATPTAPFPRIEDETDLAVEFDLVNASSFHPIQGPGKGTFVPSLKAPWTTSSVMECSDCHASDSGAAGPHGSDQPFLLKARYDTVVRMDESPAAFALCYSCHDRTNLMQDNSFMHDDHVREFRYSCHVCHDGHGLAGTSPSLPGNSLVNFRSDVVTPTIGGVLRYTRSSPGNGSCTLRCHGVIHINETY